MLCALEKRKKLHIEAKYISNPASLCIPAPFPARSRLLQQHNQQLVAPQQQCASEYTIQLLHWTIPILTASRPVHPAVVHFPIAFLFTAYTLDILHTYRTSLPAFAQNALLGPNDITRSSYYLLSLGLLTAIPAVVTGGRELVMMISKQGMHEADGKTVRTKVKATIAHAVANDIVIAVSTYIWYSRRAQVKDTIAGKIPGTAAAAYAPSSAFVFAEFLTLGLLLMGANIGGTLTYNYGVGFSSLSAGKKEGKKSQ